MTEIDRLIKISKITEISLEIKKLNIKKHALMADMSRIQLQIAEEDYNLEIASLSKLIESEKEELNNGKN